LIKNLTKGNTLPYLTCGSPIAQILARFIHFNT